MVDTIHILSLTPNPIPANGSELFKILERLEVAGEFCSILDVEPVPGFRKTGFKPMYRVHHRELAVNRCR